MLEGKGMLLPLGRQKVRCAKMNHYVKLGHNAFMLHGQPIAFRGIGVGSWLNFEHYELGVPGWETDISNAFKRFDPALTDKLRKNFFTEEDARFIRSLGINMIRVPINHHLFWHEETDTFCEDGFAWLRYLSDICRKTGLYYLPDMHTSPGGQNPDWHSESRSGRAEFWHYAVFRKQTTEIWRRIAMELKDDPMLLGYDLLNEPVLQEGGVEALNQFHKETVQAIRQVDKEHIIFLEGGHFAMDYHGVELPDDPQTAFTFHFYLSVWEPDVLRLPEKEFQQSIRTSLGKILNGMKRGNKPVLCGETAVSSIRPNPEHWTRVTSWILKEIESHGSGWCLWNYKDTGTSAMLFPKDETPWMQMVSRIHETWNHHEAERLGYLMAEETGRRSGYQLTKEEVYQLQFMIRAGIAGSDVRHVLIPVLETIPKDVLFEISRSFLLENCQMYKPMADLLRVSCIESRG